MKKKPSKNYRILKESRRNPNTGKIYSKYYILLLIKSRFGKEKWIRAAYHYWDRNIVVNFSTLKEAKEYIKNVEKPIPKDKIIIPEKEE